MHPSKETVLKTVLNNLKVALNRQQAANETATEGATDSESRAETKWDTSGLEASYLARGYAKQFEEMANQYDMLKSFQLEDFTDRPIGQGALVKCDFEGYVSWFFLLPCCGGMEMELDGEEITVITPESPVGRELLRKRSGSSYMLANGRSGKVLDVK